MKEFHGSCHCGLVVFKFSTKNIFEEIYRCNCSLCLKKSITMKPIKKNEFFILSGEKNITEYRWHKRIAQHYFCNNCGVYTHHVRRRDPSQISVNIQCVDHISLTSDIAIHQVNGASHD